MINVQCIRFDDIPIRNFAAQFEYFSIENDIQATTKANIEDERKLAELH